MTIPRRDFLRLGALVPFAAAAAVGEDQRRLRLRRLDGGAELELIYRRGSRYEPGALARVAALLRDDHDRALPPFDPGLLDRLHDAAMLLGVDASYVVISAYRSEGLHAAGRAIDVRLDGVDCADLAARAASLANGGVGCYRRARMVHLDSGAPRAWQG